MKSAVKKIIINPLFAGSVVMIIGSNITNFINYVYHLIMGRMLGPANYSELAALFSLIGFLGMIPAAFGPVIIKFISASKTKSEVVGLVNWIDRKIFISAVILTLLMSLSSPYIALFLQIEDSMLIVIGSLVFLFMIPTILNRGILQGLFRFKQMVGSVLAENTIKLSIAIALVYLGFAVFGATVALVLAAFMGWVLSRLFIRDHLAKESSEKPDISPMIRYSLPVLIQSIALTSLYSTDLILVKHFFSPHDAGIYASLSTLGKIIFFGAGPISAVMFPLVSKRQAEGGNYTKIFIYSFVLTLILSLIILLVYWVLPQLAIGVLFGASYLEAAGLLAWFGIFIMLFTLSSLLVHFCLSLGKVKVVALPLFAALFQIIGILNYHSSLKAVILVSIIITSLLLISLLIYLKYAVEINLSNRTSL